MKNIYGEFERVKTPEELMDFMNKYITYGLVVDGKAYTGADEDKFEEACKNKWRLAIDDELVSLGYGHCFDQVELERYWFKSHGYEVRTFFIWFQLDYPNTYSMHTYLVYQDGDLWKWFEHSDYHNRGIYTFKTLDKAVSYQRNKHIESNGKRNKVSEEELKNLKIYEYANPSKKLNFNEFIDYIMETGRSWKIKE